ncbi:hypothetical protein GQ44DRAFT_712238 [Phaeosphaeriaceae sp. PMI808]|nr:hypothetical protein GQ44DRAFT_712238 [Phaeosphaeriaceae sp. PMI808]
MHSAPPEMPDICLQVGSDILYKESIVPAPTHLVFPPINSARALPSSKYGDNIMVFIPTENKFKTETIQRMVRAHLGSEQKSRLVVHSRLIPSEVGEQPYDENGLRGAYNRIRNTLRFLEQNEEMLKADRIGTVLIGAIENFIQRSSDGGSAVDYGIVVMYNATTKKMVGTISRGVTVPQRFLEQAQTEGYEDEERKSGKVTVGEVLAEIFGVDKGNWHEIIVGVSRYTLLEEAIQSLEIPL